MIFHHSDAAILAEIGSRLARRRVDFGLTQAELAAQAGTAKRTVERLESTGAINLGTLLRILRVLDLIDRIDAFIPPASTPSPIALLALHGRERKRVSSRSRKSAQPPAQWTWGPET